MLINVLIEGTDERRMDRRPEEQGTILGLEYGGWRGLCDLGECTDSYDGECSLSLKGI